MKFRKLGSTGLTVSALGFGSWQLGGKGWGSYSMRAARQTLEAALDSGIQLIDTAPVYGFGHAERVVGDVLSGRKGDAAVVVSKGGLVWDGQSRVRHDARPSSLSAQLEASLRRLRRGHVDVYLLHWPDPRVPVEDSIAALQALCACGHARAWGVSNIPRRRLQAAAAEVVSRRRDPEGTAAGPVLEQPLNCLGEYASEHEAVTGDADSLLRHAAAAGWGVIAFDALARGLLGGRQTAETRFGKRDVRHRDRRYQARRRAAILDRVSRIAALAARVGEPVAALALRAVLARPEVSACLVGMKTPEQLAENLRAVEWEPGAEIEAELSHLCL